MNSTGILRSSAPQNSSNNNNVPCYSININLFPSPDSALESNSNAIGPPQHQTVPTYNKPSFLPPKNPLMNCWTTSQQQQHLQRKPEIINNNGRSFSIPVPIPNSLYQQFQGVGVGCARPQVNSGNCFESQPQRPNVFGWRNSSLGSMANDSPQYSSKVISSVPETNYRRPPFVPPPPPPPLQYYFPSSSNENSRQHLPIVSQYKYDETKSNISLTNGRDNIISENINKPFYSSISENKPTAEIGDVNNNLDNKSCLKKEPCGCPNCETNCQDSSINAQKLMARTTKEFMTMKNGFQTEFSKTNDEDGSAKFTVKIPSGELWKRVAALSNSGKELGKFVDKSTAPMKSTILDVDSSPVWEFERREKYPKTMSPSKSMNKSTQCDLSRDPSPSTSAEVLWKRFQRSALHRSRSMSPPGTSENLRLGSAKSLNETEFTGKNPNYFQTANKSSMEKKLKHVDNICQVDDFGPFSLSQALVSKEKTENRHRRNPVYLDPWKTFQPGRPTFQEVMEYLEKADKDERTLYPQPKSRNFHHNNEHSHQKRECSPNDSEEDELLLYEGNNHNYESLHETKYSKKDRKGLKVHGYKESYTEVVCRQPPAEMFPVFPGSLDFPKNALGRALSFLESHYWQQVLDGFRLSVRLTRHHPEVICEDLEQIVWRSEKHISSLKSCISRAALACFTELFTHVPKPMEPFLDKLMGKILLKSMDCNKFLRWECRNVLNAIVQSFPIQKSLSCLELGYKHKSGIVKATIAVMLHRWVKKVGADKVFSSFAPRVVPMIINLLQERCWEARSGAKDALSELVRHPNFTRTLRHVIPYDTLISIARRVRCIRDLIEQDCLNFRT